MVQQNPMDMVIGAPETQRDAAPASRHLQAAKAATGKGDRETAIAELRRSVSADPGSAEAMFELAYRLDLIGEEDEEIALYERAPEPPPANITALVNLAVMYEDRGDYARAERCLRQVLETTPNPPRARLY